jgi:hypothetical protein
MLINSLIQLLYLHICINKYTFIHIYKHEYKCMYIFIYIFIYLEGSSVILLTDDFRDKELDFGFYAGHLFLIIIDIFLYLCLSGWFMWKHMVHIFEKPSFVICVSKHHHHQASHIWIHLT